ncbi:MAG: zinc-ribbon domain-containing protein [Candidatus Binatia bacterium]
MADQLLFCTACDKENRQQARFCGYCGQPLQRTSPEKQDSANEQTVEPVTPAVAS